MRKKSMLALNFLDEYEDEYYKIYCNNDCTGSFCEDDDDDIPEEDDDYIFVLPVEEKNYDVVIHEMYMNFINSQMKNTKIEKKGIIFYKVGHNATHDFYIGQKGGKIYRMYMHDKEYNISEIKEIHGHYWGHY